MNKFLLFFIITILVPSAFAKKASSSMIAVYRATDDFIARGRYDLEKAKLVAEVERQIAQPNFSHLISGDIQYACSKVLIRTELSSHDSYTGDSAIALTVYCQPRATSEKQLFSYARRCEENPVPECFTSEMRKLMDRLKPTEFSYE